MARSIQPQQPVEIASCADEEEEEEEEDRGRTRHLKAKSTDVAVHETGLKVRRSGGCVGGRCVASVRQASRTVARVFSVENPHNIDRHSRSVFPLAFLFVNVLYWLYYLFL